MLSISHGKKKNAEHKNVDPDIDIKIPKTVERIWRVLLKNCNTPMTTREIARELEVTPNAIVQAVNRYPEYFNIKSRKPLLIAIPITIESIAFREDNTCLICKRIESNPKNGEIFSLSGKPHGQKFNDWQFICSHCSEKLKTMKLSEYLNTLPEEHREALLNDISARKVRGGIQHLVQQLQVVGKKIRDDLVKRVTLYQEIVVQKRIRIDAQLRVRVSHVVEMVRLSQWILNFLYALKRNESTWRDDRSIGKDIRSFFHNLDSQNLLGLHGRSMTDLLEVITNNDLNWQTIDIYQINSSRYVILCKTEISASFQDVILSLTSDFSDKFRVDENEKTTSDQG